MKTYIILTLNLCTMHGANMYTYNKARFLKEQGYQVFVYSAEQGNIMIPGLREYRKYQMEYLRLYPGCFSRKRVEKVLRQIGKEIHKDQCEEIIIESTNIYSALWGEELARYLNCKHLVFILQESFDYSEEERNYLRFKLSRHELAGITKSSVGKMLKDENLAFDDSMCIKAYCTNSIDECEDNISDQLWQDAALTIGSIGRLEKKYVLPLMGQLKTYFSENASSRYNLVLVGGTREKKQIKRIKGIFSKSNNVNLIMTGSLYPVPRSFVDTCDLFISAAGSAVSTYYCSRPTITLNPETGDIIGIIGLTCFQGQFSIYSSNYPISELGSFISMIQDKGDMISYSGAMEDGSFKERMNQEFTRQISLGGYCQLKEYYDTYAIKFSSRKYRPFNYLGKVFPVKILYKGLVLARNIMK